MARVSSEEVGEGFGLQRPVGKESSSCTAAIKDFFGELRTKFK